MSILCIAVLVAWWKQTIFPHTTSDEIRWLATFDTSTATISLFLFRSDRNTVHDWIYLLGHNGPQPWNYTHTRTPLKISHTKSTSYFEMSLLLFFFLSWPDYLLISHTQKTLPVMTTIFHYRCKKSLSSIIRPSWPDLPPCMTYIFFINNSNTYLFQLMYVAMRWPMRVGDYYSAWLSI